MEFGRHTYINRPAIVKSQTLLRSNRSQIKRSESSFVRIITKGVDINTLQINENDSCVLLDGNIPLRVELPAKAIIGTWIQICTNKLNNIIITKDDTPIMSYDEEMCSSHDDEMNEHTIEVKKYRIYTLVRGYNEWIMT